MPEGTVRRFFAAKGFGFIEMDGGDEVFVHQSQIKTEGFRKLLTGQKVSFTREEVDGKSQATDVTVTGDAPPRPPREKKPKAPKEEGDAAPKEKKPKAKKEKAPKENGAATANGAAPKEKKPRAPPKPPAQPLKPGEAIVRRFFAAKGFGFIETDTGEELFVHQSQIKTEGFRKLLTGQTVSYTRAEVDGKSQATEVTVTGEAPPREKKPKAPKEE